MFESPRNPRVLWVGTTDGLYVTVDAGQHWRRFGKSFPHVMVEALAMSYRQRDLVVGTHGRGAYVVGVGAARGVHRLPAGAAGYPVRGSCPPTSSGGATRGRATAAPASSADNPPRGAVITYYLRDVQPDGVKLVIVSAAGDTLRSITGSALPGLQQVTWDLSSERPRARGLGDPDVTRGAATRAAG